MPQALSTAAERRARIGRQKQQELGILVEAGEAAAEEVVGNLGVGSGMSGFKARSCSGVGSAQRQGLRAQG